MFKHGVKYIKRLVLITLDFVTAIFRDFVTSLYSIFGGDFVMLTKDKKAALSLLKDKANGVINDFYSSIAQQTGFSKLGGNFSYGITSMTYSNIS